MKLNVPHPLDTCRSLFRAVVQCLQRDSPVKVLLAVEVRCRGKDHEGGDVQTARPIKTMRPVTLISEAVLGDVLGVAAPLHRR